LKIAISVLINGTGISICSFGSGTKILHLKFAYVTRVPSGTGTVP
jgi:hypothetical protein